MPKKKRQRRTCSAPEKIKMVLEVLKEEEPLAAIGMMEWKETVSNAKKIK